ncbi:MAG: hypothetical protein FIB02_06405 [Desulfuromonas sp.]|nr:hypothetical protein [Desulfuromonas sp.]
MSVKNSNGGLLGRARYGGLLEPGRRCRLATDGSTDSSGDPRGAGHRVLGGECLAKRLSREYFKEMTTEEDLELIDYEIFSHFNIF